MDDDFVTMAEAEKLLNVSSFTIWKLVKEGTLPAYQSAVDRRKKLIRRSDIEELKKPQPFDAKKAAA